MIVAKQTFLIEDLTKALADSAIGQFNLPPNKDYRLKLFVNYKAPFTIEKFTVEIHTND